MLLPSLCAWLVLLASPSASRDEPPQTPAPTRNRLAGQTSLYLLQHAGNPVDWYPWGPEAFERAQKENRPILLSVGYSTCYWCHVMERESFENDEIASYLNQHFVCIKVDREERPDIDQVYMNALQVFAGRGGWPMTLFLTPDGRPFFAATYLPAEPRDGLPSFLQIARAVDRAWTEKPEEIQQDADRLTSAVRRVSEGKLLLARAPLSQALVEKGLAELAESFDPVHGGFGFDPQSPRRPKFPEPINLLFLLDQHRKGREVPEALASPLAMVEKTLDHLMRGGIRDQLGGGYHRYSTDRSWSIPHFEKMLYDNALLARVFLTAHDITGDPRWRAEAESILDFVSRDLTSPDGAFYSAIDAEVDALEGASYVWTRDEVLKILGNRSDVDLFLASYGLDQPPNFEGDRFVLLLPRPLDEIARRRGLSPQDIEQRLAPLRASLLEARQRRPQPLRDEKILTSWNGLMLGAYAEAFRVLGDVRYRQAAERSARFLLESLRNPDGSLLRSFSAGKAGGPAFLDDYAYLGEGLLLLHQATGEPSWRAEAERIAQRLLDDFADPQGGFFFTADDHETLIARVKDSFDGATPNPNGVATRLLLTLVNLQPPSSTPRPVPAAAHVQKTLESLSGMLSEKPSAMPSFLLALDEHLRKSSADQKPSGFLAGAPPADSMSSASRVRVSARLETPGNASPGQTVCARVDIQIADGWHLNANPAGGPTLVPTQVETPPDSPVKLVDARYPAGTPLRLGDLGDEIPVYSGKIRIEFSLQIPDSTPPGELDLPILVRVQACDDRSCLAPSTVSAPIRLRVARP